MTARDGEAGVSVITDHPFSPRREWWSLCGHDKPNGDACNLSEAAHAETAAPRCRECGIALTDNEAEVATRCVACRIAGASNYREDTTG